MGTGHPIVRPDMVDGVDLGRIGVDTPLLVGEHRVVFPARFPQLVDNLEILISLVVTGVVVGQLA